MKTPFKIILFFVFFTCVANVFCQQILLERGIELYSQGKNDEAIQILKQVTKNKETKANAEAWNYLGMAFLNEYKNKDGRKALERAVKLAPQNSVYHSNLAYAYLLENKKDKARSESNKAIQLDPQSANAYFVRGTTSLWEGNFDEAIADADRVIAAAPNLAVAYVLKSEGLLYNFGKAIAKGSKPADEIRYLEQASQALELCMTNCQNKAGIQEKLEAVKAFHSYFSKKDGVLNPIGTADESITPLKFISKPKPRYTDQARQANAQGTIRMAILFSADGEVKHVLLLNGLGYGLDQQAVLAAKGMKFEPAQKDGKPISVVKIVEFGFAIY